MARHIEGVSRDQTMLLPDRLDDYVGASDLVRVIDRFVERQDMVALGFRLAIPAPTGRPGYAPQMLLKLYVYGYINGVRSSRRLERNCCQNVEVMWLVQKLAPDHKTIAMFRKESSDSIKAICAAFVQFCRGEGLLVRREVAIDGSKLRAAASRRRVVSQSGVTQDLAKVKDQIEEYLKQLDEADEADADELDKEEQAARVRAALEKLKKKESDLKTLDEAIESSGRTTLVTSEPDARAMTFPGGSKGPGYNLQIAVSTDTHLIVHHELVQNGNDMNQLYPMASGAQAAFGLQGASADDNEATKLQVLADAGYSNGEHANRCEADGIIPVVPPQRAVNTHGNYFDRTRFIYDAETDSFVCPAGQRLTFKTRVPHDRLNRYEARNCQQCPLKAQCTKSNRRIVTRHWYEAEFERMAQRTASPEPMRRRRSTAEHPFGSIKGIYGARFLMKGLKNTRTEAALEVLAYNIKRTVALLGVPRMLAALA